MPLITHLIRIIVYMKKMLFCYRFAFSPGPEEYPCVPQLILTFIDNGQVKYPFSYTPLRCGGAGAGDHPHLHHRALARPVGPIRGAGAVSADRGTLAAEGHRRCGQGDRGDRAHQQAVLPRERAGEGRLPVRGGGEPVRGRAEVSSGPQGRDLHAYAVPHSVFIVTHEVTVSIHNVKTLGRMVDEIVQQGEGMVTLNNFAWKAVEVSL